MGLMRVRSMEQEQLWGTCGSALWARFSCGADVSQIYGAGAAVGHMWIRSMGQELLWELLWVSCCGAAVGLIGVRSIVQDQLWGICVSDLWGRSCCGAHVGQIYGARVAVG